MEIKVAQGRLFLCLGFSICCKAFLAFTLNLNQSDLIYIKLLMWVQLRVYRGSIMFEPTLNLEKILIMALRDVKVRSAKPEAKAYKLTNGDGMVLLVHPNGSKYWCLSYRFDGKEKMLALGIYPEVTFADAKARRDEARKQLANGIDPSDKKKTDKIEQAEIRTFKDVAIEWHATNKKWSKDHND